MKAYIFKMNGRIIDKKELDNCLQFELDYCDLFALGKIECEDCSCDNCTDIITIEEIEVNDFNIETFIKAVHENAKNKGWWDDPKSFAENIALMHSELSEALEEYRNNNELWYYGKGNKPEGVLPELADVVIRIFDYVGSIEHEKEFLSCLQQKHNYNLSRSYKHGGKKI